MGFIHVDKQKGFKSRRLSIDLHLTISKPDIVINCDDSKQPLHIDPIAWLGDSGNWMYGWMFARCRWH
jgi:hypothetical protein